MLLITAFVVTYTSEIVYMPLHLHLYIHLEAYIYIYLLNCFYFSFSYRSIIIRFSVYVLCGICAYVSPCCTKS